MREKYNVQTYQKYHLKSLMLHFEGSFKVLKDTKNNLGDDAVMVQCRVVKSYGQSLPGNGEWSFVSEPVGLHLFCTNMRFVFPEIFKHPMKL